MNDFALALIWLGAFSMVVLTVYFIMKYKTMMQPKQFDSSFMKEKSDWQKPGIVVLGIGFGALIVGILKSIKLFYMHGSVSIGIVVIFAGISLIVAQQLDKKNSIEE